VTRSRYSRPWCSIRISTPPLRRSSLRTRRGAPAADGAGSVASARHWGDVDRLSTAKNDNDSHLLSQGPWNAEKCLLSWNYE
jgi:hypothetical protein